MLINKLPIHREVLMKVNNTPVSNTIIEYTLDESVLAEQQQQQQGSEQQGQHGHGFVQNVQYQTVPQYGVAS
jgi:hypothetical protein